MIFPPNLHHVTAAHLLSKLSMCLIFSFLTAQTQAIAQSSADLSNAYEFFGRECLSQFGGISAATRFTIKYCDCVASSITSGLSPYELQARAMGFRRLGDRDLLTASELVCDTKKDLICLTDAPESFRNLCETLKR
jgi:hypothetical protein